MSNIGYSSTKWNTGKDVRNDRQLTHTCFRCSARYATSMAMIQHMREEHSEYVAQPATRHEVGMEGDRYNNTIATCPYCQLDCQTRKKLMRHLALQHRDADQEEPPNVKLIRLDDENKHKLLEQLSQNQAVTGPFVTPEATESKMVQNLLKVIGTNSNGLPNGSHKMENKSTTKLQYKCFWCEASFRKRGKLMDHINSLHKHNKQQNQAEAEMLSMDDPHKPLHGRHHHLISHRPNGISQMELPPYLSYNGAGPHSLPHRSHHHHLIPMQEIKPVASNQSKCSFKLAGSLANKGKTLKQEEAPLQNNCKFYFGKKDNPLANVKISHNHRHLRDSNQRRYSLPNMIDEASTSSPYNFPYSMLPHNPMAAAMQQHNYNMMNIRPQMMNSTPFYAPRMPMIMPGSEYMMNPMMDRHNQTSQAQFIARMNAMAQMSPLARPKPTESPLDLTKS